VACLVAGMAAGVDSIDDMGMLRHGAAGELFVLAFVDIDSTQKRVYGYKKQGARFGHTKI
jgi:hypothetical protein